MEISIYRIRSRVSVFISSIVMLCSATGTFAASPSVTAVLSNSQPAVGQMVQLEIKVNGSHSAAVPKEISVDGLEIHQTSQQYESSLSFGFGSDQNASSVTYGYTVLPLKAGQFKIPPQTVRVGNDSLRTPELTLNVTNAPNGRSATVAPASSNAMKPWAQLTLAKSQAYIGQPIEAQIEIGFDARM